MRLNKIVVLMIFMFMITVIFSGCGDNKPDDVRQEIWDEVKSSFLSLDKNMRQGEKIDENYFKQLILFITKYNMDDLTELEKEMLEDLSRMAVSKYNIDYNHVNETDFKEYNFYKNKLSEAFNIK